MLKTHHCGDLRKEHAGQEVTVAGWVHRRRDHGGLIFIDLRDSRGLVQVVLHPDDAPDAHKIVHEVRNEFVLSVTGEVSPRKEGTENPEMPTGEIEVLAKTVEVLNEAKTPPFPVNEETEVEELLRLRYRYLDLRRDRMQRNLRVRDQVTAFIREFLRSRDFVEVETPILTNSTPEGARDYLVPARLHPGKFYALPQSPQQYKQLLMVAGIERYFQIPGPLRDEVQGMVRSRGLEDGFRFVAGLPSIDPYWLGSDVFAFPSWNEGFGIVIAEAAAAGLPVVACDIPGVREAATACRSVELLPVSAAPEAWANAIVAALDRGPMSDAARGEMLRKFPFTIEASVRSLMDLYGLKTR